MTGAVCCIHIAMRYDDICMPTPLNELPYLPIRFNYQHLATTQGRFLMSKPASATAKIVRFHRTGGADVLQLDDVPLPEPTAGEVRIRVKAIGLNRAEVMFRM